MKKERLFYLDFIRAMSVILIIINHFNYHLSFQRIGGKEIFSFIHNNNFAYIGVSLFIIISGAALMYTYQANLTIKDYLIRRFFSIYPIFWTGYALAFLYQFYINRGIASNPKKWTFIYTILGLDGYVSTKGIQTFYIVGEWFLGFIIIFYLIFPLLRILVIKTPKTMVMLAFAIYLMIYVLNINGFGIYAYSSPAVRSLEFLFGMYFIYYIKSVNIFKFVPAFCIMIFMIFSSINIDLMFKANILGISTFIVLAYIANHIKLEKFKDLFYFVSKYSFASILANQLVMLAVMKRFSGHSLTTVGAYCLFAIVFAVIHIIAVYVYKISGKVTKYFLFLKAN